jgi:acyl carrier protein
VRTAYHPGHESRAIRGVRRYATGHKGERYDTRVQAQSNPAPDRFTLADLAALLVWRADVPESVTLDDPDIALRALEVDSVGVLAVALELERRYGMVIPDDTDWWSMSLGQAADYVDGLIRSGR